VAAIGRLYEVKRRPATSPLIVHLASKEMARNLSGNWPDTAEALASHFWPGPLTLVLPKHAQMPAIVTAGLETAGLRVPAHPVALRLLKEVGLPIAAPSANRFGELSPTMAEHVRQRLGDDVDMILDGGPAMVGIESTVLSLAGSVPLLLRPGMVSQSAIEQIIGPVELRPAAASGPHLSPGLHRKHYSPHTPLYLASGHMLPAGRGAYLWVKHPAPAARPVQMPDDPGAYGARLYEVLHELDDEHWDWIVVEPPPDHQEWAAILDRLRRAAEQ
jgi:L-threonylcarbamoyladenylate synthase